MTFIGSSTVVITMLLRLFTQGKDLTSSCFITSQKMWLRELGVIPKFDLIMDIKMIILLSSLFSVLWKIWEYIWVSVKGYLILYVKYFFLNSLWSCVIFSNGVVKMLDNCTVIFCWYFYMDTGNLFKCCNIFIVQHWAMGSDPEDNIKFLSYPKDWIL